MISGICEAAATSQLAESELRVDLSMGRKIIGKYLILAVLGAVAPRGLAESELRVDLNMGRTIIENPKEYE